MTDQVPDHVAHWPQRHRRNPLCHAAGCGVTDPAQLRYCTVGLCCAAHVPTSDFRATKRVEKEHVSLPFRQTTVRHGLLPDPVKRRRRQPRKRSTA